MAFSGLLTDGGGKKTPLPKISDINPSMMKLSIIIPYLKNIQKYINHVTHLFHVTHPKIYKSRDTHFLTENKQLLVLLYQETQI